MNNLSFDKEAGYSITYPKNTLLQELSENNESSEEDDEESGV